MAHGELITGDTTPLSIQTRLPVTPMSFPLCTRFLGIRSFPPPLMQSPASGSSPHPIPILLSTNPPWGISVSSSAQTTPSPSLPLDFSLSLTHMLTYTIRKYIQPCTHSNAHTGTHTHTSPPLGKGICTPVCTTCLTKDFHKLEGGRATLLHTEYLLSHNRY